LSRPIVLILRLFWLADVIKFLERTIHPLLSTIWTLQVVLELGLSFVVFTNLRGWRLIS
jgi:hypothetical protein